MNKGKKISADTLIFPGCVLCLYAFLFTVFPEKFFKAISVSGNIFLKILIPLCLVFIFMMLLNIFLKPGRVVKFMGRDAGLKGIMVAAASGILSMGPIYAWYPLLKDIREKGAGNRSIAIFLGNRAVKPFLLPLMVAVFGLIYVVILTCLTFLGSLLTGYLIDELVRDNPSDR
jgi:uncharacterized membrane protein YraQ (UPF0718 family)